MSCYSSVSDVNENVVKKSEEKEESVDLGQEFLSQAVVSPQTVPLASVQTYSLNDMYGQFGQPFVTTEGFICLYVSKDIRVDINTNQSICVLTPLAKVCVDSLAQNIGVIHPMGRVYKESGQNSVHIESGTHLAKMSVRGITFTSLKRTLIYLVDISGCKTTADRFRPLNYDFTDDIFYVNSLAVDYAINTSYGDLFRHRYESSDDKSDNIWFISGIRIRHILKTGDVSITKSFGKIVVHVSPAKNQLKITSPQLRVMANYDPETCLQVVKPHPRDEQRVVSGAKHFRVKYGSQKAGFDASDQLVLM